MPGGDHCCVPQCTSDRREKQESLVLFHTLPKDKLMVKKWIHAIRRDVGPNFQLSRDTCVCSQHFTDNQYCQGQKAKGARLKKDAVPHVFAWMADDEDSASSRRKIPRDRTIRESAVQLGPPTYLQFLESELQVAQQQVVDLRQRLESVDAMVKQFSLERFKDSPEKMAFYTGLPDGNAFDVLWEYLDASEDTLVTVRQLPDDQRKRSRGGGRKVLAIPLKEQLFITLARLRRGMDEELLADLTLTSQSTISRLLATWINFLYLRLGSLPTWPSSEQVSHCLPDAFRTCYPDTFLIIDCFELRCEVPSSLPLQSQLYSTYKSHTTFKGLIGIIPSGAIAFVSELFTGSISDRELFEQSGLLKLLESIPRGRSLMADRGFDVEDLLAPLGIKLNVPARKSGLQLTEAGVLRTQRIARVRIHVERAINRAKNFTIFDKVIPLSLAGSINQMWTVCCLLTNFQPPLLEA